MELRDVRRAFALQGLAVALIITNLLVQSWILGIVAAGVAVWGFWFVYQLKLVGKDQSTRFLLAVAFLYQAMLSTTFALPMNVILRLVIQGSCAAIFGLVAFWCLARFREKRNFLDAVHNGRPFLVVNNRARYEDELQRLEDEYAHDVMVMRRVDAAQVMQGVVERNQGHPNMILFPESGEALQTFREAVEDALRSEEYSSGQV